MAKPVLKVKKDKNGKNCATVPCIEMLSYVYEKNLPLPDKSFNEIINLGQRPLHQILLIIAMGDGQNMFLVHMYGTT